jgi:hypothetical protein
MAKVNWSGMEDGTPSSKPERNPQDQMGPGGSKPSWKGLPDGTPSSTPETDPMKAGK